MGAIALPYNMAHLSISRKDKRNQIKFVNPNTDNFPRNIENAADLVARGVVGMALPGTYTGQAGIVVGSGPSLKDPAVMEALQHRYAGGHIIYACKAAIKWLFDHDIVPHYGVSMDPGAHIASPKKIFKAPGVTHIIASTSDPMLFDYLLGDKHGPPSRVLVFHSACGLPTEIHMYKELFPVADVMGGGFNVVNRAIALSLFMGINKLTLAGTDCGWRKDAEMYVDGPAHRPGVDMNDGGQVDGKVWNTRPDMLASGVAIARMAKEMGDDMTILGDVLPASLMHKDDAFLDQCAKFN